MTLKATEFIRRFLLHVLPSGFVRIRHYGFLANRVCQEKLALCRALLERRSDARTRCVRALCRAEGARRRRARGDNVCPSCGEGRMVIVAILPKRFPVEPEGVGADP